MNIFILFILHCGAASIMCLHGLDHSTTHMDCASINSIFIYQCHRSYLLGTYHISKKHKRIGYYIITELM